VSSVYSTLQDRGNGLWNSSDFASAAAACGDLERWANVMRAAGADLRDYRASLCNACHDEVGLFVSARARWAEDFGNEWFPVRAVDTGFDDLQVWFAGAFGGRTVLLRDLPAEVAERERAPVLSVTKPLAVRGLGWRRRIPELDEVHAALALAKLGKR